MAVMRLAGTGHALPPHAHAREEANEYVVAFEVPDFTQEELTVETRGPLISIRAEQREADEDARMPFRLRERVEESFRLPDDARPDETRAFYEHGRLELRVPRAPLSTRVVPIERPVFAVDADAEPC